MIQRSVTSLCAISSLTFVVIACVTSFEPTETSVSEARWQAVAIEESVLATPTLGTGVSNVDIVPTTTQHPDVVFTPEPVPTVPPVTGSSFAADSQMLDVVVPPCIGWHWSGVNPCERRDTWPRLNPYVSASYELIQPNPALASEWQRDIDAAIAQWPLHVKWATGSRNIITATGSAIVCESATVACYGPNPPQNCDRIAIQVATPDNRIIRAFNQEHLEDVCNYGQTDLTTLACLQSVVDINTRELTKTLMLFAADNRKSDWEAGRFINQHDRCTDLHAIALHEAGHVFGLGDITSGESVMISEFSNNCNLSAFDIGATMAIYQSGR